MVQDSFLMADLTERAASREEDMMCVVSSNLQKAKEVSEVKGPRC
jgi:hypothetical protein